MQCSQCAVLLMMVAVLSGDAAVHPLSDEFISRINARTTKWTASRYFHQDTPLATIQQLMGVNMTAAQLHHKTAPRGSEDYSIPISDLPETFDPRTKWPECKTLNEIRDQGPCGACYAFSAVETMTDRYCIAHNGTKNFHFSAQDIVSCAGDTGGCQGGFPWEVFQYWTKNGLVSGGNYGSKEGCLPYSFKPCDHTNHATTDHNGCGPYQPTPECHKICQASYNVDYENDKVRGKTAYAVDGEENIKAELVNKGPVTAAFSVFADFIHYSSGIYHHVDGEHLGAHAVKIIGYGVEEGTKYWLVANSWNDKWGDGGFFKILRGVNECGFEDMIATGDVLL